MSTCMGLECFIISLREAGFTLILLWLLTLSIVYGMLSHSGMPKSVTARGVISISAAFLVLLAAAATPAVSFLQNLITASVLIAFGLILAMIFLEITGTKKEGKHVFEHHPKFFGGMILFLVVLVFIGAGGLEVINIPVFAFSDTIIAVMLFGGVMIVSIWVLMKESGAKK
jgi:hypothetical protein